jgi:hypothetical protein
MQVGADDQKAIEFANDMLVKEDKAKSVYRVGAPATWRGRFQRRFAQRMSVLRARATITAPQGLHRFLRGRRTISTAAESCMTRFSSVGRIIG